MDLYALRDVRPVRITVCKQGANRQVWLLRKSEEPPDEKDLHSLGGPQLLVKSDWSVAYCIVAEPGTIENGGQLAPDLEDQWADEDEIRKAAHYFMRNGDLSVGLHDSLLEYGAVVENAVALSDVAIETPDGPRTIKKGSWYVALEPNEEGKQKIEAGEFGGISLEGTGQRTLLVQKAAPLDDVDTSALDEWIAKYNPAKTGMALPTLERVPGKQNWVDRVGGFPRDNWIYRAAKHLHYEKGMAIGHAIATAVNAAKKLCATGDLNWPGKQSADPRGRADACKAVAQWEAMKARSGVAKARLSSKQRKQLPTGSFAIPERRAYPIHDESHARNALSRVAQHGSAAEQKRVRGAVCRRYPKICSDMKKAALEPATEPEVERVLALFREETPMEDGLLKRMARKLGIPDEEIEKSGPPAFDSDPVGALLTGLAGDEEGPDLDTLERFREWAEGQDQGELQKALTGQGGSIAQKSGDQEDDVGLTDEERERIEKIEGSVGALDGKLDQVIEALGKRQDTPPTPDEMKKQLDEFADATASKLDELSKSLGTLADQGSAQRDDTDISKSDGGKLPDNVVGLLR